MKYSYTLIKSRFLVPRGYKGLTFYPYIFYRGTLSDPFFLNHERIHIAQQVELLVLPFYVLYFLNYLINFLWYFDHDKAYRNIIFEKEAYGNEHNLQYLDSRKPFQYLRKKLI